jgi:hypothetical protein
MLADQEVVMFPVRRPYSLLPVLLVTCFLLASCSDDNSSTSPTRPPQTIPNEVMAMADNVFSLIGMALEGNTAPLAGFWTEPEALPDEFTDGFVLTIYCEDMEPEPPHGPLVNGSITITARQIAGSKRLLIDGELVLTDEDETQLMTVAIVGAAIWDTGGPDVSEPDRMTGTFTIDSNAYDLGRIFELLQDEWDGGDQPVAPLPVQYRGTQLHGTMIRVLGQGDEQWQYHTYHRFYLSDCGQYYMMQLGGNWGMPEEQIDAQCTGTINWHTEGAVQRLYFHDDEGMHDRLFTVVEYGPDDIILNIDWGGGDVWDMWFEVIRF